jgi:uncharacterized protein
MAKRPSAVRPFWQTKTLTEMSASEWESLCDGCGRCCMNKVEDADTAEIYLTKISCKLLDLTTCRCSDYKNRRKIVPDCIRLTPEKVANLNWLPKTCAYRLVAEGADIPAWHPLKTGDPNSVHEAGISVRGFARSEARVKPENIAKYIVPDFPEPKKFKAKSVR